MSDRIVFDANSNIIRLSLLDSTSTTGGRKTSLAYNTSGLIISTIADVESYPVSYKVAENNIETIATLGTYAAPSANKCRFKEIDSTNMPGWYELQLRDARFSVANSRKLGICIFGATGLVQFDGLIDLDSSYFAPGISEIETGVTYQTGWQKMLARLAGKRTRTGNAIDYRNQADNATVFRMTYTPNGGTPS
jgi:hypothetical protein